MTVDRMGNTDYTCDRCCTRSSHTQPSRRTTRLEEVPDRVLVVLHRKWPTGAAATHPPQIRVSAEIDLSTFTTSAPSASATSAPSASATQSLVGVVCFMSRTRHYTCFVRVHPRSGYLCADDSSVWLEINDKVVSRTSSERVLASAGVSGRALMYAKPAALAFPAGFRQQPLPTSGTAAGLPNRGNSCYLNTALQLLLRCPVPLAPSPLGTSVGHAVLSVKSAWVVGQEVAIALALDELRRRLHALQDGRFPYGQHADADEVMILLLEGDAPSCIFARGGSGARSGGAAEPGTSATAGTAAGAASIGAGGSGRGAGSGSGAGGAVSASTSSAAPRTSADRSANDEDVEMDDANTAAGETTAGVGSQAEQGVGAPTVIHLGANDGDLHAVEHSDLRRARMSDQRRLGLLLLPFMQLARIASQRAAPCWNLVLALVGWSFSKGKQLRASRLRCALRSQCHPALVVEFLKWRAEQVLAALLATAGTCFVIVWLDNCIEAYHPPAPCSRPAVALSPTPFSPPPPSPRSSPTTSNEQTG